MKRMLRVISATLAAVMVMSVYVTPAVASQGSDRGKRDTAKQEIYYLDAEVKVVDGQPVLKVEADKGYTSYEFPWPEVALVDGREEALKRQGSYYLLPTEDGYEKVHIEDFEVAFVAGQITLITEVNPVWKLIAPAVVKTALVRIGLPLTASNLKAAAFLMVRGLSVTVTNVRKTQRGFTTVRNALEWLGLNVTLTLLGNAAWSWWQGNCVRSGRRTPDGFYGDVFCSACARRYGIQFFGPRF